MIITVLLWKLGDHFVCFFPSSSQWVNGEQKFYRNYSVRRRTLNYNTTVHSLTRKTVAKWCCLLKYGRVCRRKCSNLNINNFGEKRPSHGMKPIVIRSPQVVTTLPSKLAHRSRFSDPTWSMNHVRFLSRPDRDEPTVLVNTRFIVTHLLWRGIQVIGHRLTQLTVDVITHSSYSITKFPIWQVESDRPTDFIYGTIIRRNIFLFILKSRRQVHLIS